MAQLLSRAKTNIGLSVGAKITGTVIEVGKKVLILDIGAKAEGIVSDREFQEVASFIKTLKQGDKIVATILIPETRSGQALLSIRQTAQEKGWKEVVKAKEEGRDVEAYVLAANRGGLTVSIYGVEGFIPTSLLSSKLVKNINNLEGRVLPVKVIEAQAREGKLVLSERAISEKELIEQQEQILKGIKPGERYKGKVVNLTNFGAFVAIEAHGATVEGLVHLSQISYERISDPAQVLQAGQEIEVVVIGQDKGKLALSIKQAQEDPWEKNLGDLKEDAKVKGKVTKLGDFGATIEIKPGVEGKVALNKIPDGVSLREGDLVDVFVESIDRKKHTISLGLVLTAKPVGYK